MTPWDHELESRINSRTYLGQFVLVIIIQTLVGPFLTLFGLFFATLSAETPFLSIFDEIILGKFLRT